MGIKIYCEKPGHPPISGDDPPGCPLCKKEMEDIYSYINVIMLLAAATVGIEILFLLCYYNL